MRKLLAFSAIAAILAGCGSQVDEQGGETKSLNAMRKIIKASISYPEEALDFLRTHPFVKTIGIRSGLFARELDIHPNVWGKYVNSDSALITKNLVIDGKAEKYIFAKGFLPSDQIAKYLDTLDPEELKSGVSIARLADNVHFKQEGWSTDVFHTSIGMYLDRKKYVSKNLDIDGKTEKYIFAKGFLPSDQIAKYLDTLDPEELKSGVSIERLADNVHFKQEGWPTDGFHTSIGMYLDRKKYVSKNLDIDGKTEKYIFAKGFLPSDQIAKYLDTLDPEELKSGVSIARLADNVHFKQEGWPTDGFHTSIGHYLDKKKYVSKRFKIDGKQEAYIFAK